MNQPQTLFQYYTQKGKTIPSISVRSKIYESLGLGSAQSYSGSASQNKNLLQGLTQQESSPVYAGPLPLGTTPQAERVFRTTGTLPTPNQAVQPQRIFNKATNPVTLTGMTNQQMQDLADRNPELFDRLADQAGFSTSPVNNQQVANQVVSDIFSPYQDGNVFKFANNSNYFVKKGNTLYALMPNQIGDYPKYATNINTTLQDFTQKNGYGIDSIQTPTQEQQIGGLPSPTALKEQQPINGQNFNPEGFYSQLFNTLNQFIGNLNKRGLAINPSVAITPEKAAEFMVQAENEINPYYSSQLKVAREGFLRSLGYSQDEVLRQEQVAQRKYGNSLRELQGNLAEAGLAQSGARQREEQQLAQTTQEDINAARRRLSFETGNLARMFTQKYGTEGLGSVPQISKAPEVSPGESNFGTIAGQLPVYELSPETYSGLTGEQEFARRGQVKNRVSELESAFRTKQGIGQLRQFYL